VREFHLDRVEDVSGVSGISVVAEGVIFTDGRVAMRWLTGVRSTAVYDSIEDVEAIHGHEGRTRIVMETGRTPSLMGLLAQKVGFKPSAPAG
jgi:hypothetical protein